MSSGRGGLRLIGLLLLAGSGGSFALRHRATDAYHALLFAGFGAAMVIGGAILLWKGFRSRNKRGQL